MDLGLESVAPPRPVGDAGGPSHWPAVAVAVGCVATIAVGAAARASGQRWGAALAPFFASWSPHIDLFAVPAVIAFAAALLVAPRLLHRPASPAGFALAAFVIGLVLRLGLAAARGGPARWDAVFSTDPEAAHEYLPALPAFRLGLHAFLTRFADFAPSLPTHPSGHPPGLLVALHLLRIATPGAMAALTIGVGALAVPLTHLLARRVTSEPRARIAALLFALAPSGLVYGATSSDALYATLGLGAACALMTRRSVAWGVIGPALLAVASFFSFALLAVGAWAVLAQALSGDRARAMRTAGAAAVGVLAFYALLHAVSGFDVLATLRALSGDYHRGIANVRPYAFWLFGSPVAYLVALGLPIAWLAARSLAAREPVAAALAAVVALSALLGFTKAETERIWLFLVPLACLAAATAIRERRLPTVLALLAVQSFAVELLLFTTW